MRLLARVLLNAATATVSTALRAPLPSSSRMSVAAHLDGPEIAVLGGGFGGLYTALRLRSLDWTGTATPRVTLVDRNERFNFSPMLYELATGTVTEWEVAPLYEDLLAGTDIEFVRGDICGIDETERVVRVTTGRGDVAASPESSGQPSAERLLPYDQCVLALGSEAVIAQVPGAAEHSQPFYTTADAMAVRQRVRELRENSGGGVARIAIVGGGYIGVELAANLASAMPRSGTSLTLVHRADALLGDGTGFSQEVAARRLADAGVDVRLGTAVAAVAPDALSLMPAAASSAASSRRTQATTEEAAAAAADGGSSAPSAPQEDWGSYELPVDLTLWTAGNQPSAMLRALGMPLDANGRVAVDGTLRVTGKPRLVAVGDGAAVVDASGAAAPPTAQAAMQQADYAAWNIRAAARNERPLAFRYANLGEMLSLGQDEASISALGQLVKLSGPLAYAGRRAVYAFRQPTPKQAAKVGLSWGVDAAFSIAKRVLANAPRPPPPPRAPGA